MLVSAELEKTGVSWILVISFPLVNLSFSDTWYTVNEAL